MIIKITNNLYEKRIQTKQIVTKIHAKSRLQGGHVDQYLETVILVAPHLCQFVWVQIIYGIAYTRGNGSMYRFVRFQW